MQQIPIKKFEKIVSEVNQDQTMVITKITDFKSKSVTYEVRDSRQKAHFKNLAEARDYLNDLIRSRDKQSQTSLSIA